MERGYFRHRWEIYLESAECSKRRRARMSFPLDKIQTDKETTVSVLRRMKVLFVTHIASWTKKRHGSGLGWKNRVHCISVTNKSER